MAYKRLAIDTSVLVTTPKGIDLQNGFRNANVESVAVLSVPAGAVFNLHFSQQGDAWDILGAPWSWSLCGQERNDGIFFTNLVAGAGFVIIEVSFASGPALTTAG
jgi:hypothetical protein